MASAYFQGDDNGFELFATATRPAWRLPQLGALGALVQHWSLPDAEPALLSLPTGTGKTAVGIAASHIAQPRRTLVVVPSKDLRVQLAAAFASQEVLRRIGAVHGDGNPTVVSVEGRVEKWSSLKSADVVVALPNSISPAHYESNPPPADLFDLLIIDEAHHAPARTWRAILDHFGDARALLLTATPRRRDGQRLPGFHAYHYPLRQALEERVFKPVEPRLLELAGVDDKDAVDALIIAEVQRILSDPAHATSTLLVRAATRARAIHLADLYTAGGVPTRALHSGLKSSTQEAIVSDLRNGTLRAVAVVGMLIEGFDLPSLRVAAYHDKHKSIPATAQLIGRLARVDDAYPQPSILVTAKDADVYPELQGTVRSLYDEDADWTMVLPGVIDDEIAAASADRAYAHSFTEPPPPSLAIDSVNPLRRAITFELPVASMWSPPFADGEIPQALAAGQLLRGQTVLYSGLSPDATTLLVVTTSVTRPRWHNDPGLDSRTYELHLVSYRRSTHALLPSLLLFNTANRAVMRELLAILDAAEVVQPADPLRLQQGFDSLDRISVSSVGVRNTYAGRGVPSYRMYAGSGVDRGLREVDTAFGALGHAMIQVAADDGAYTAGVATAKGKYWETRYAPLRAYDAFVTEVAERYWFPPAAPLGQLLPQVQRGRRLDSWPTVDPLAVELDHALVGRGWHVGDIGPLELLDLRAGPAGSGGAADRLPLELVAPHLDGEPIVWQGDQDLLGTVVPRDTDLAVRRGFAPETWLSELLTARPPTIFFIDGTTVHGTSIVDSRVVDRQLPAGLLDERDWGGVDIQSETRKRAAAGGKGMSVHEALETQLMALTKSARHAWVICNDGKGEIADYITITIDRRGDVGLGLWHAKFASGASASVRVGDVQEVVAQAIKSRRWITDVTFWEHLGARLAGREFPAANVMHGKAELLKVLCGEKPRWSMLSFVHRRPIVSGQIGVVQPGLSGGQLHKELAESSPPLSAVQVRDLLAVFVDAVAFHSPNPRVVCAE